MTRPENKCSNCSKQRTQCKHGRGTVVWVHCPKFKEKMQNIQKK